MLTLGNVISRFGSHSGLVKVRYIYRPLSEFVDVIKSWSIFVVIRKYIFCGRVCDIQAVIIKNRHSASFLSKEDLGVMCNNF